MWDAPYSFPQLMQFVWPGLPIAQTLYVAAKLGIADLLASGQAGRARSKPAS